MINPLMNGHLYLPEYNGLFIKYTVNYECIREWASVLTKILCVIKYSINYGPVCSWMGLDWIKIPSQESFEICVSIRLVHVHSTKNIVFNKSVIPTLNTHTADFITVFMIVRRSSHVLIVCYSIIMKTFILCFYFITHLIFWYSCHCNWVEHWSDSALEYISNITVNAN